MSKTLDAYESDFRLGAYDADMDVMHPKRHEMIRVIRELLPFDKADKIWVLDLGTGTGILSLQIAEQYPKSSILAVDGSERMIEMARVRLKDRTDQVEFQKGDFRELNLANESLDLVVSTLALHHLTENEKFHLLKSIRSALMPGGYFFNGDLIASENTAVEPKIQDLRIKGILERARPDDERFQTYQAAQEFLKKLEENEDDKPLRLTEDLALMENAGFKNIEVYWKEYRECVIGGEA